MSNRLSFRVDKRAIPKLAEYKLPWGKAVVAALHYYAKQKISLAVDLEWVLPQTRDRSVVASIPAKLSKDFITSFYFASAKASREGEDLEEVDRLMTWDFTRTTNEILLRYLYADYLPPFPRELPSVEETVEAMQEVIDRAT